MTTESFDPQSAAVLSAATRSTPPSEKLPPGQWVRRNLFNTWYNSLITVVLGAFSVWAVYRLGRFVFVTGRWEPVSTNLELFMVGQFPREERWRIIAQIVILAGAIGAGIGSMRASRRDLAEENDVDYRPEGWRVYAASYWAVSLYVAVVVLAFCRTPGPYLLTVGALATAVTTYLLTRALPRRLRMWGWTLAAVGAVVELQVLTGTGGWAWFYTTLALAPLVSDEVGRVLENDRARWGTPLAVAGGVVTLGALVVRGDLWGLLALLVGLYAVGSALRGDRIDGGRLGAVILAGVVVYYVYAAIGLSGIDWSDWGGFHLNLIATALAIMLAFPIGVMLALGRRSSLPAIKVMSVAYIEFFRGAPLITFLLSAQFFLGFFLDTDNPLSLITRAIAAVTLFSAAYIAEIIRGGLQAVPKGQVEAGQAVGLSPPRIMRLIVMPQALRAVIPAMVGQFISLFKDTTLFNIITIPEYLSIREIVHAQEAFRGFGIGETLVFVAFGFWAVSFTMSRESQRLERRLGVGER